MSQGSADGFWLGHRRKEVSRIANPTYEAERDMITELHEVKMNVSKIEEPEPLLSIQDLHVWYELRRFGFGHAGYVKAVDGVSFDME